MACYIAVSTALIAYTLQHTSTPASGVLHVLQVTEKRPMSILRWWPETVIFGPVFQVQPQIQMSCSQLHKRAERIGCMLMEKGRLNTGDHVALIYPPGQFLIKAPYLYEQQNNLSSRSVSHLRTFIYNNSMWRILIHYGGKSCHLLLHRSSVISFFSHYLLILTLISMYRYTSNLFLYFQVLI